MQHTHAQHSSAMTLHDSPDHVAAGPMTAGHDKHEGHSVAMFRDRFWLSLLLTVPIVL